MAQVTESLYVGSVAEFEGKKGLILDVSASTDLASLALITGETVQADVGKLKVPSSMGAPGQGGDAKSFDFFLGPMHKVDSYAELISDCLSEKGFCVMKVHTGAEERAEAIKHMKAMGDEGRLSRLAAEVEEGYLGAGSKGKVAWMDPGSEDAPTDTTLLGADAFFSQLVNSLLPYNYDCLEAVCPSRTTGLANLSLEGSEHVDYPNPIPEDKVLGDFLKTWRLAKLHGVKYLGPEPATVTLTPQEEVADGDLPIPVGKVSIDAGPNTVILYKPSIFQYSVVEAGNTLSLKVTFMEEEPQLVLGTPGDISVLGELFPGPAPPNGGKAICDHLSTRMPANWDQAEQYTGSQALGCDAVIEFPRTRFDWEFYYNPDPATSEPWHLLLKHFSMVEGLEYFDNKYFSIPQNEAMVMGPMQRHLLECGAMNMASMGITKKVADREPHHAGCSVGLDKDDWPSIDKAPQCQGGNNVIAIISNRFSFTFNLKGCNYVADTACSASLCASHFARWMMSDRTHDKLEFFVCMGIHNCLGLVVFIGGGQGGMFSKNGRCFTFNDTADGYQRGDGCSGFVMKWGDKDSDCKAVWRGSMTGQNGRAATLTAPNGLSQEDVCWKAIREAGVRPGECTVWSCHGTGTSLGDPIEIGAVRKIMKNERETTLCVNTNKTNHGHFEGGAAMTSLLSAMFQVTKNKVNPNCHLNLFNAHIVTEGFDASWYNELQSWGDRKQGHVHVSSFGFGGTNGHVAFWGRSKSHVPSPTKMYKKRLLTMAPPEVRPIGPNPADWEHDFPDKEILPGDVYSIPIAKSDPVDAPIRYVKEEVGLEGGAMDSDVAYSISGNFNDWAVEDMDVGEVPGMRTSFIEVPEEGHLEFNFRMTVSEDLVLAPAVDNCTRKTAKVEGPEEGLTNKWCAVGVPGTEMKISLFASQGIITVNWVSVGGPKTTGSLLDLLSDI